MSWNLASGLDGKGVLVTGAAGGIGREVALAFATAGAHVAAVDLSRDKVESSLSPRRDGGAAATAVQSPMPRPKEV